MATVPRPAGGLFAGVEDVFNTRLGVRDYRARAAAKILVGRSSEPIDGQALVEILFKTLRDNWRRALRRIRVPMRSFHSLS